MTKLQYNQYGYLEKPIPVRTKALEEKYNCQVTELKPYDSHKSFYNKAYVLDFGDIECLLSYETIVMVRDKKTGQLHKTWNDWSATTGRHIAAFGGPGKKEYLAMPYTKLSDLQKG